MPDSTQRAYLRFDPPLDPAALAAVRAATADMFAAPARRYVLVGTDGDAPGVEFGAENLIAAVREASDRGFTVTSCADAAYATGREHRPGEPAVVILVVEPRDEAP